MKFRLDDQTEITEFLSCNLCYNVAVIHGRKEGTLYKKGKLNMGGWRSRFFWVDTKNGFLKCSETKGSPLVDSIDLSYCYVTRQPNLGDKFCFVICQYKKHGFDVAL